MTTLNVVGFLNQDDEELEQRLYRAGEGGSPGALASHFNSGWFARVWALTLAQRHEYVS